MIFLFVLFVLVLAEAKPGYSDSSKAGNEIGTATNTDGNAFGYAGSFSGSGGLPSGNVPPFASFVPQFDFSSFFEQLNKQHQELIQHGDGLISYSYASSNSGGTSQAQSSITFNKTHGIEQLSKGQGGQAGGQSGGFGLGNRGGFAGGYGGGFTGSDGSFSFSGPLGGDGAAVATGSVGPGGVHQTAAVFPENPNAPNVNTRFGGEGGGDDGGFKSVFTSSKSVSSNVNGQPQNYRQASTTVNDNGKITTYTAHNP